VSIKFNNWLVWVQSKQNNGVHLNTQPANSLGIIKKKNIYVFFEKKKQKGMRRELLRCRGEKNERSNLESRSMLCKMTGFQINPMKTNQETPA
jgi:hypothetical protein